MTSGALGLVEERPVVLALRQAFPGIETDLAATGIGRREIEAGRMLCNIGDDARHAWVVVSGRVEVTNVGVDGIEQSIASHGPGELVGESALLEGGVRRARVRTLRRTRLVELDREWMAKLITSHPQTTNHVLAAVLGRGENAPPSTTGVIAVLPLSTAVLDESRDLFDAVVSGSGHVGFDGAERPIPDDPVRLAEEIDRAEVEHGGAVLLGDPLDHRRGVDIADVADRVVFVADAARGPEVGALEREVIDTVPRRANAVRILLLVHAENTDRPRDTRSWIDRREIDRHLHLRRRSADDVARVSRHVVGRPLTLAVGAGGARSAGAVGTVHALTSRGVAIDAVAGVSGGAIIASMIAVDPSAPDLDDRTDRGMRRLLDFTLPVGAVIAGKRAWGRIRDAVGDRDIADTWLPLSITTTDLTANEPVNHTAGPMADAIYASISIPGVFPPVDIDGNLHVDGAVFDAVPVEGARGLSPEGHLVAVDLTPPRGRPTPPLPRVMPGLRLLLRRITPGVRSTPVPNPLDTLMRSTTVASARRRVESLAAVDCHVHLNLSEFGVLEFDKVGQIISLGEAQSQQPLDELLSSDDPPLTRPISRSDSVAAPAIERPSRSSDDSSSPVARFRGSISLASSDFRFRARRFAVAIAASTVVLALLLLMTGVVNQLHREPEVAVATFGGDHWVVPAGADGVFTSTATFSDDASTSVDGGRVLVARTRVSQPDGSGDLDAILVGHEHLPDGSHPAIAGGDDGDHAAVVLSEDAGFSVGDDVLIGPIGATVTSTVPETTVFSGMPLVFVPLEFARSLVVDGQPLLSAIVVDDVPDLPPGLSALAADIVAEDALGPIEKPVTTLRIVQVLLALVAAMIIGAVVYLATLDRLRDIAVLRAMGVGSGTIGIGVAAQAIGLGVTAGALALLVQTLLNPIFPMRVHLETTDRFVLIGVSVTVALLAGYAAIRRTLRVDPAEAFGGPGA